MTVAVRSHYRCQIVAGDTAASQIAQVLEPKVTAAAREGAEEAGVGGKRGRGGGGGGLLGSTAGWLIVGFLDLLGSPSTWSKQDTLPVPLHAAHLAIGGSDKISKPDFIGVWGVLSFRQLLMISRLTSSTEIITSNFVSNSEP